MLDIIRNRRHQFHDDDAVLNINDYTEKNREYAMWRAYRSIDIAKELDCDMIVLWLAREGTLCTESKSPVWAMSWRSRPPLSILPVKDEDSYEYLENRDFESLEMYVINLLMGIE